MADGKWITGLTADTPLPEAARHVLFVRLEVVRDHLPKVVDEADRDPEHVHQLRVAIRRADAALRLFEPCLPRKAYKGARERLRHLRRAAGEARDWDVFLLRLADQRKRRAEEEEAGLDLLAGYALGRRAAAQTELAAAVAEQRQDFEPHLTDLILAVRAPDEDVGGKTLAALARTKLARLRERLEEAASGDLNDYAHLHQVRIAGKRLRYAMEVFADCFAPPFREELYPRVEEMQEVLGRANDHHVAGAVLSALRRRLRGGGAVPWGRYRPGVERLLRYHLRALPRERRAFLKWWGEWRQGPSEALLTTVIGQEQPAAP